MKMNHEYGEKVVVKELSSGKLRLNKVSGIGPNSIILSGYTLPFSTSTGLDESKRYKIEYWSEEEFLVKRFFSSREDISSPEFWKDVYTLLYNKFDLNI